MAKLTVKNKNKRPLTEAEMHAKLAPMEKDALEQMELAIKAGNFNFIKLYLEYRFGRPKQMAGAGEQEQGIQEPGIQERVRIITGERPA